MDYTNISVEIGNLKALDSEYSLAFAYDNFEELYEEYYKKMDEEGLDKVFE